MSNLKAKITFCRRRKGVGIYTGNVKGKVIRLVDRQVCTPTDPDEAKFLMEDPEIEIFCTDEKEQNEENQRNKEKDKNEGKKIPPKDPK